jgi:predicted glycoside hydrolase/deacetylase ChbG (UPF0249 family)
MIIINADDWGRSESETNAALACFRAGRITSASAMVFMKDSERAAGLARECGIDLGLHLNLSQKYDARTAAADAAAQERIVRFMGATKYAVLLYHPGLRRDFREVFKSQMREFLRLHGKAPSHLDGHQHRHLCANLLIDDILPRGQRIRRNFSFWPGEKGMLNRTYRSLMDRCLSRRYILTDYFFSLGQILKSCRLARAVELARQASVEVMTHPIHTGEYEWLMSAEAIHNLRSLRLSAFEDA